MAVEAHRRTTTLVAAALLTVTFTLVPIEARAADLGPFSTPQEFVAQQYRDFLGREADADGLNHWSNLIRTGVTSPAGVIERFMATPEFTQSVAPMVRLYFAYFLRIPDYDGLSHWAGEFQGGRSLGSISQAFATSAEFQARYGTLSNPAFVDKVYLNVLGRPADPGGRAHWTRQLDLGLISRGAMMVGFSESAEYRRAMRAEVNVTMVYVGMLRRTAEQSGFSFWVEEVEGGRSIRDLIAAFLVSGEYAKRFAPQPPAPGASFSGLLAPRAGLTGDLTFEITAGGDEIVDTTIHVTLDRSLCGVPTDSTHLIFAPIAIGSDLSFTHRSERLTWRGEFDSATSASGTVQGETFGSSPCEWGPVEWRATSE